VLEFSTGFSTLRVVAYGMDTLQTVAVLWIAAAVVLLLIKTFKGPSRGSQPSDTPPIAPGQASASVQYVDDLERNLHELDKRVTELTAAVAHGIEHVDRTEKRVRGIVTGAKRRFAAAGYEDPGVEAEADSLPRDDAESIEGVQTVPSDVGPDNGSDPWSRVPGMNTT